MIKNRFLRNILRNKGFTILEILVVIVIIGVLASIILVYVSDVKTKAYKARVNADLQTFVKFALIARGNTNKSLQTIAGGGQAPEDNCLNMNLKNISAGSACYVGWAAALQAIQTASGGVTGVAGAMNRDPWGSPYLLDWGDCNSGSHDVIFSAGPNGWTNAYYASSDPSSFDSDDIYLYLPYGPGCPSD